MKKSIILNSFRLQIFHQTNQLELKTPDQRMIIIYPSKLIPAPGAHW